MQSPAAQHYQGLCTAAMGEERRLAAHKQRRNFKTTVVTQPATRTPRTPDFKPKPPWTPSPSKGPGQSQRVCFKCGTPGHFAMNCTQGGRESRGRGPPSRTKQVRITAWFLYVKQCQYFWTHICTSPNEGNRSRGDGSQPLHKLCSIYQNSRGN